MSDTSWTQNKSTKKPVRSEDKLLLSRQEAAELLSISQRALDYLIASKALSVRRIGSRVLAAISHMPAFCKELWCPGRSGGSFLRGNCRHRDG